MKVLGWVVAGLMLMGVIALFVVGQGKLARQQLALAKARVREPEVRELRKIVNAKLAANEVIAEDLRARVRARETPLKALYRASGMSEKDALARMLRLRQ